MWYFGKWKKKNNQVNHVIQVTLKLRWLSVLMRNCNAEQCFSENVSWKHRGGKAWVRGSKEACTSVLCKLYSLEFGGYFLKLAHFFPLRRYKDLKVKGKTHYHMSPWDLPPSLTKVLPFYWKIISHWISGLKEISLRTSDHALVWFIFLMRMNKQQLRVIY